MTFMIASSCPSPGGGNDTKYDARLCDDPGIYVRGFILSVCCLRRRFSDGHGGTVSSPQHFFLGKLEQAVNQYSVHILLQLFLTESVEGK